jgi:hypothetical protein
MSRGAPGLAVRYLERALAVGEADGRNELLIALAEARIAASRPGGSRGARGGAVAERRPAGRARISLRLGWALHHAGRVGEAATVFAHAKHDALDAELDAALEAGYLTAALLDAAHAGAARARLAELTRPERRPRWPSERELIAHVAVAQVFASEPYDRVIALAVRAFDDGRLITPLGGDSRRSGTSWDA